MPTGFYTGQGSGAFTLQFKGLDEIERKLKAMPDKVAKKVVRQSLMAGGNIIAKEASRLAPSGRHTTSNLKLAKDTLKTMVRKIDKKSIHSMSIKIGPTAKAFYAHMVEFGTAPHTIKARRKKALAIRGKGTTGNVFVTEVQHPGAKAKPFLRPAFDNKGPAAVEKMRDYALRQIEKIAGEAA